MPAQRRQFTAQFKAQVALEAIRGIKTASELASEYQVHPVQISQWKKQALDGLSEVFTDKRCKQAQEQQDLQAQLLQQIGKLQMELEWMKKKSGRLR